MKNDKEQKAVNDSDGAPTPTRDYFQFVGNVFTCLWVVFGVIAILWMTVHIIILESPGKVTYVSQSGANTVVETANGALGKKKFLVKGVFEAPVGAIMLVYGNGERERTAGAEYVGYPYPVLLCTRDKKLCAEAALLNTDN